jgi:hypothetical protein
MTSENPFPNPYDAVLNDLRAKREQIDQTIRLLESLRGGDGQHAAAEAAAPDAASIEKMRQINENQAGMFLGMTIPDAAKKLLTIRRCALGNLEIATALQAGGLVMKSADPVNTVGAVMTRRFQQVGDIVKVGRGVWGLKEWYPNRSFKPSTKGTNGDSAKNVTTELEQPSEPEDDDPFS